MKNNNTKDLEYEKKTGDYSAERVKKIDWLILIFCVLIAIVIWLVALDAHDPMIEKDVKLVCSFIGGEELPPQSRVQYNNVRVYGPQSVLDGVSEISLQISKNAFSTSREYEAKVTYPDGVKPVDDKYKTVNITLPATSSNY